MEFTTFIYYLGATVFAVSVAVALFWTVDRIERPRRVRK